MQKRIDPVGNYIHQASVYVSKQMNLSYIEAREKVKLTLEKYKYKRNPKVKFRYKKENADVIERVETITDYINEVLTSGDIIVPSFTTYYHPDKMKSIHAEFMNYNTKQRSAYKKAAFKAKQDGNIEAYTYNDIMQKTMKIFNNSLSGAYGSKSTVLRNPSAHYTLTSITRCVSSIGNAFTESIVYGNKHFNNVDNTFNYITSIISHVDLKQVQRCINHFKLYIPTTDDVMKMILESSRNYWRHEVLENKLKEYISKLSDTERAAILYVNDLWHIKMYNENLIRTMINEISVKCEHISDDHMSIANIPESFEILGKLLCYDDIKGLNVNYEELRGSKLGRTLISTIVNVNQMMGKYSLLLKTFLYTDIMPPNIAFIRQMYRKCIVLSDTDSTCGSYDKWVKWYFGKYTFGYEAVPVTGVIMTILSNVVDYNLSKLSSNMNISNDRLHILKMKNEFFWTSFISTNINKHYYASTAIQEGNVFKEQELELKGVHLIGSANDQTVVKQIHNTMKDILNNLSNGKKLSLYDYIKTVADIERDMLKRFEQGDIGIFRKDKIKEEKAYKQSKELSPYLHHLLWEEVFAEQYGHPGNPTYMVIKIPTIVESKKDWNAYLETLQDNEFKNKLIKFMNKYNKDYLGTFRVPFLIASSRGIPKEIIPIINKNKVILENLKSAYIMLETLGFYKKLDKLLLEQGY